MRKIPAPADPKEAARAFEMSSRVQDGADPNERNRLFRGSGEYSNGTVLHN